MVNRQTVPRAELTAVCIVLETARQDHIHIVVDAAYILRGVPMELTYEDLVEAFEIFGWTTEEDTSFPEGTTRKWKVRAWEADCQLLVQVEGFDDGG